MPRKRQTAHTLNRNRFSDIALFLFVLFLPTQFGKHFFLPFSYVSGVRIDYLAPTIYLTDILAFAVILTHLPSYRAILRNKATQIILFLLSLTLIFAISRDFGLYKFLKVIELVGVAGVFLSPSVNKKSVFYAVFVAAILQLYIAFLQLIMKHSLNGDFYFLGERPLSLSAPGIAKAAVDGVQMLRPYGTFSHPNSMAGFFLVLYSYYLFHRPAANANTVLYWICISVCALLVILSFSKVAITIFFLVTLYYLIHYKAFYRNRPLRFVIITIIIFVCALFFKASTDPLTIPKRISLTWDALNIIKSHPVAGVGLGNYLFAEAAFPQQYSSFILQPVHNIFLLTIAELGIPISIYLFYLLFKYIKNMRILAIPVICTLLTGMFDHYWLTLQQNWLLMGVIVGLISSSEVFERFPGSAREISEKLRVRSAVHSAGGRR